MSLFLRNLLPASLLNYYELHPFRTILSIALIARLISAIFSHGYGFSDDHFLVIEVAQQWVDGVNEKLWMPWNGNTTPSGHSLFYPGLHYLLFLFLKLMGVTSPVTKMYIVRVLHAFYSMAIVFFGFKISKKISGQKTAILVGWLLAILWFIPMLSIRNMVEMVCIPPLVYATWLILIAKENQSLKTFLLAGFVAGLAFSFRFQTIMFIGGLGLAIWISKQWIQGIWFGLGAIISITLIQGGVDYYIWHKPFAEFIEYSSYNIENAKNYVTGPWYKFIPLVAGLMIPPISLFIFFGIYKSFKKYLWVILPALCFFAFHSYFPNKQERFILPVIPFFIMAGVAGWQSFKNQSLYWLKHKKLLHGIWVFFWIVNGILLVFLTPSSTKIIRVDAMTYLSKKKDAHKFMIEASNSWGGLMMPLFYANKWELPYQLCGQYPPKFNFDTIHYYKYPMPDYIVFAEEKNIETRVDSLKKYVKGLKYETTIKPSFLDKTMHFLNPVNVNQTYYIYKVEH
jgi:hypothetical protein